MDLTPYLEKERETVEGIDEDILGLYQVDDRQYGIPFLNFGTYLFYNKELFDEAGLDYPTVDWNDESWSWEKMVEYAEELTTESGDIGERIFGFMSNDETNKQSWLFGGDFLSADDYENGAMSEPQLLSNPRNIEAIQAHVDLIQRGISPTPSQSEALTEIGDPFVSGKVAMTTNGGWAFSNLQAAEFEWGIAALPFVEGRQASIYVDPWSISAGTEHPDEAWEFLKFLISAEHGARSYMEITGATPVHSELLEEWYDMMAEQTDMSADEVRAVHEGLQGYGRGSDNHQIESFRSIRRVIEQTMPSVYDGSRTVEDGFEIIENELRSLD